MRRARRETSKRRSGILGYRNLPQRTLKAGGTCVLRKDIGYTCGRDMGDTL